MTSYAARFERWMEHTAGGHRRLLDMGRGDLLVAAGDRDHTAKETELEARVQRRIAALWRTLADGLAEDEHVSDRYTPEAIADLMSEQRADRSNGE